MSFGPLSRRRLVLLAATTLGANLLPRSGAAGPDQGIGGTGAHGGPIDGAEADADRGIGGTGVIGTIRKFGSIVVNDLRIAYPADAAVYVDGQPASASALKIGQVVRVVAHRDPAGLSTQTIDVASEVVGKVERVGPKSLTVLGQSVSTAGLKGAGPFAIGDRIAVSGLRRNDGTIAASLIEPRADGLDKVAGPITQGRDGGMRVGALRLTGADGALIGQRAVLFGQSQGGQLAVARGAGEAALFPSDVRRLSIEAYVERRGGALKLGSGLAVSGNPTSLPGGRDVRAVLNTSIGADGRLNVESLRSGDTKYQTAPKPSSAPERGPGGTKPMDFGHGPGLNPRDTGTRPGRPNPGLPNPSAPNPSAPNLGLPGRGGGLPAGGPFGGNPGAGNPGGRRR